MVWQRYQEFDVAVGRLYKKAREEGYVIPCKRGCDACCYDVAQTTQLEMPPLIERLRQMSPGLRATIKVRLDHWFEAMRKGGVDPWKPEPDIRAYHRVHEPCPLLDREKHECLAYDARPIACRGHNVVDVSPVVCANRANEPPVPSLTMEDVVIPFLKKVIAEQRCDAPHLCLSMALLPAMLAVVWPLVCDPKKSISKWLRRAGAFGVSFGDAVKEDASAE